MSELENIVRPFQRPNTTLPYRIFDGTEKVAENVVLAIGIDGEGKTFNESFSESITTYADKEQKELHRETETKRIKNPDDESQFVDVQIVKKLTTEEGAGKDYQKTTLTLTNTGS